MASVVSFFAPLKREIARLNRERGYAADHPWYHRLSTNRAGELLGVEFFGEYSLWFDDGTTSPILHDLLALLASGEVAPTLRSFAYRTEAALAANGTYDYDIDPLVDGQHEFPNLTRLHLDQGQGEHGYKILTSPASGDDWNEAGVLARMLKKAPQLEELVTPVPPNEEFFRGRRHPLVSLDVDAGFDQANFVRNLAGCSRFPQLRRLVFTDLRQTYLADWREKTTTFADYLLLFGSPLVAQLKSIYLREVALTPAEVRQLLTIRSAGVEVARIAEPQR